MAAAKWIISAKSVAKSLTSIFTERKKIYPNSGFKSGDKYARVEINMLYLGVADTRTFVSGINKYDTILRVEHVVRRLSREMPCGIYLDRCFFT